MLSYLRLPKRSDMWRVLPVQFVHGTDPLRRIIAVRVSGEKATDLIGLSDESFAFCSVPCLRGCINGALSSRYKH